MLWNLSMVFTYWLQSESYEYSHLSTLSEAIKWSKIYDSKSLPTGKQHVVFWIFQCTES